MHTNLLFNPSRPLLREETPDNLTTPGEQNPASPTSDDPTPTAPVDGEDTANFNLDATTPQPEDPTPSNETTPNHPDQNENPNPSDEYTVDLPEDLQTTDEFRNLVTQQAKAAGIDAKAAGKYVTGVITALQQAEQQALAQSTKQLKAEWGPNFNANMAAVKNFTAKLRAKSGLTPEDLAPLQSPKGFKLLHTLMTTTSSEDTFIGTKTTPPARSNAEEAHAMLTDPNHPDYAALDNPEHPRHMEANRKYNRLVGLS